MKMTDKRYKAARLLLKEIEDLRGTLSLITLQTKTDWAVSDERIQFPHERVKYGSPYHIRKVVEISPIKPSKSEATNATREGVPLIGATKRLEGTLAGTSGLGDKDSGNRHVPPPVGAKR